MRIGESAPANCLLTTYRSVGFIVTPNQVKPFFSASLQQPRHNTASARDLAAHPVRNLLVDIEEAA